MRADGEGQDHLVPRNAPRNSWCGPRRGVFGSGRVPRGMLWYVWL